MQFNQQKVQEISLKIKQLVDSSPISELESNLHALIQGMFTKMELVSREEFDIQAALLQRTRQQLEHLQAQVTRLEQAQNTSAAEK